MASSVYNAAKNLFVTGALDWDTDDIRCLLVTSSYTFDADHATVSAITNELSGTGYSRQSMTCSAPTIDTGNDQVECDASDTTFASLNADNGTIAAAVVFKFVTNDADSIPIAYVDGVDVVTNGSDVIVQWGSEGVFKVT